MRGKGGDFEASLLTCFPHIVKNLKTITHVPIMYVYAFYKGEKKLLNGLY